MDNETECPWTHAQSDSVILLCFGVKLHRVPFWLKDIKDQRIQRGSRRTWNWSLSRENVSQFSLSCVMWSLTVVGHVSVSLLEDEVDSMSSSSDLLNGLTVSHSCCTVSIYLHQLVGHLQHTVTPCLPSGGKCIKHKTEYMLFQAPTNILCRGMCNHQKWKSLCVDCWGCWQYWKLHSAARHQRDNYRSDYYYFQSIFQSNILLLRSKVLKLLKLFRYLLYFTFVYYPVHNSALCHLKTFNLQLTDAGQTWHIQVVWVIRIWTVQKGWLFRPLGGATFAAEHSVKFFFCGTTKKEAERFEQLRCWMFDDRSLRAAGTKWSSEYFRRFNITKNDLTEILSDVCLSGNVSAAFPAVSLCPKLSSYRKHV